MTPLSAADRAALQALAAAATPGPWFYSGLRYNSGGDIWCQLPGQPRSDVTGIVAHVGPSPTADADIDFITAARDAVPRLLATVAALDAENARLRAALQVQEAAP